MLSRFLVVFGLVCIVQVLCANTDEPETTAKGEKILDASAAEYSAARCID